jgi:hypothetical protein
LGDPHILEPFSKEEIVLPLLSHPSVIGMVAITQFSQKVASCGFSNFRIVIGKCCIFFKIQNGFLNICTFLNFTGLISI